MVFIGVVPEGRSVSRPLKLMYAKGAVTALSTIEALMDSEAEVAKALH